MPRGSRVRGAYLSPMRHLYIHVPFCRRRCSYCDFSVAVRKRIPAQVYVDTVLKELDIVSRGASGWVHPGATPRGPRTPAFSAAAQVSDSSEPLESLYVGGGTPSLLPPDALATLLTGLFDAFSSAPALDAAEVTLEANPEDVTPETAAAWRRAGINRVSLGAQSFDDRVLAWMHRPHDPARIGSAVREIGRAHV